MNRLNLLSVAVAIVISACVLAMFSFLMRSNFYEGMFDRHVSSCPLKRDRVVLVVGSGSGVREYVGHFFPVSQQDSSKDSILFFKEDK